LAWCGLGAKTYFIDESTDYTGNGCENTDLNTITQSLKTALDSSSWTGARWVNGSAWPSDFIESCSATYGVGGDGAQADTKSLAVFAGHGSTGLLSFGHKKNNVCNVDFSANMRLGSMAGATAAVGMWLGCDALKITSLGTEAHHQWMRQQLGWNNTIAIGDNEPRDFFNATDVKTNARAWLDQMDGSGREPVVYTQGTTSDGCWSVHNSASLKNNVYTSARGGGPSCGGPMPASWYCWEWIDL
jgi:hypothetical protein